MPANKTVDKCGTKTVLMKTTGHEKLGLTCVLAVTADGAKLSPLIVFKRKKIPAIMRFVPGVIVRANEKGWMDSDLTREWLHRVWNKRPGASICKRSMLVWDSFRAHLTQENKDAAENIKTDLNVIPGGLTSILSPLDVAINKPFKDRMKEQWAEWMFSGKARKTAGGNLAKPDLQLVVKWVKEAWDSIPVEVVKKSFLKCGISNELDGTKDHYLFEDFEDATLEMDDQDDYTADIDMLDETYNLLFPDYVEESDINDDDMPDETFQILAFSDDDD